MGYNGTNRLSAGSKWQVWGIGKIAAASNLDAPTPFALSPLSKGGEGWGEGGSNPLPDNPMARVSGFEHADTHYRSKEEPQ